jgi:hypothetical protein
MQETYNLCSLIKKLITIDSSLLLSGIMLHLQLITYNPFVGMNLKGINFLLEL